MFNNEFLFFLPTDSTKNTNVFSLSPDEPDEPDGWRNVLFLPTDDTKNTNLFCVLLRLLLFYVFINGFHGFSYLCNLCNLLTFIIQFHAYFYLRVLRVLRWYPSPCPMFHAPFLYLHRRKVRGVGLDGEIIE